MITRKVTVTLAKGHRQIEVSRSEAANMRLLGLALTLAEEHAYIRRKLKLKDQVHWRPKQSGYAGPLVMQMSR